MNFKKLIFSLIVIAIGTAGFPAVSSAQAVIPDTKYVVKLKTDSANILSIVGTKIDKKFPFSKNPIFKNVYGFDSSLSLTALKQLLGGSYDYLEEDHKISVGALTITPVTNSTNDPLFTENAANIDKEWGLVKSGFVQAWNKSTGSKNVKVAIIDTGVDETHEDLDGGQFATGYNVLTGLPIATGTNSDDNGHGTLVAGVIGANTNNGVGISGALWQVTLMPVKALNGSGSGTSSEIAEGIVWASDNGANVINLSLGGLGFAQDTTLADAITYAFNKNVVVVAAAGNDVAVTGGNLDVDPVFPICDDNGKNMVIGVTATDVNDLKPDFANFGKACVDVSAPGKRIVSTINHDPATGRYSPDVYAYASGTSLSVPFVTAQAALLKSLFPLATNRQIRDRIISTTDNIDNLNLSQCGGLSCKGYLGGGRINVSRSVQDQIVTVLDGDLVIINGTQTLYYINGGKKQLVTPFVYNQRFNGQNLKPLNIEDLDRFPEGSYAEPLDGTLIKTSDKSTVYYMSKGLRLPLTYQVFTLRGFNFNDVKTLSTTEVYSWIEGSMLTPPEGSLVRSPTNQTVYWVVGGVLHPINYKFWVNRGLNIFPVIYVSSGDITNFSKGDPYIL